LKGNLNRTSRALPAGLILFGLAKGTGNKLGDKEFAAGFGYWILILDIAFRVFWFRVFVFMQEFYIDGG
jgi:hypothetical protein